MGSVCDIVSYFDESDEAMCCGGGPFARVNWQCWKVKLLIEFDAAPRPVVPFKRDLTEGSNSCIDMSDIDPDHYDDEYDAYEATLVLKERIGILCCSRARCWGLYETYYR